MDKLRAVIFDRVGLSTKDSFDLLYLNWWLNGNTSWKPHRLGHILHMTICWCLKFFAPVTYFKGFLIALSTSTITTALYNLQATLDVMVAPFKAVVIAKHMHRLRTLTEVFNRLDDRYHNPRERAQIDEGVIICRQIICFYCAVYSGYAVMTWLGALITGKMPHYLWFPYFDSIPNDTLRYWLQFTFEALFIHFMLNVSYTNDVFPVIYMRALRTHVKLLAERVSRVGSNPELSAEEHHRELVDCIVAHREILYIVDVVGAITSLTIFLQFAMAAATLCACMLNVLIFAERIGQIITIIYYMGVLLQTGGSCYQASMLEAESSSLATAIFHCNWLNLDKRSRTLLVYFMQRAQEDIAFTALKLFQINLKTNLSLAKFSFTLYTFMNEMGLGNDLAKSQS
uniref:Odorant receptor n=2 Tax=Ceratitis capitata TaxID=7213 RepID=W8C7P2_CERCA